MGVQIINSWSNVSANPRGIDFDGKYFYVSDATANLIYQTDRDFNIIRALPTTGIRSRGIVRNGPYILAAEDAAQVVALLNIDGVEISSFVDGLGNNYDLSFDGRALYIIHPTSTAMRMYSIYGDTIRSLTIPAGTGKGVAFDGKYLLVTDDTNDLFFKLDRNGKLIATYSHPVNAVISLCYASPYYYIIDTTITGVRQVRFYS